jgi:hypothetical protein
MASKWEKRWVKPMVLSSDERSADCLDWEMERVTLWEKMWVYPSVSV